MEASYPILSGGKPTRTRKPLGYSPEPYMGILPFLQTPANILSI